MNQPTSLLDLADAVLAAPAAGLVEMKNTRVPRRRRHLSRVCEYAAAVDPEQFFFTACAEKVVLDAKRLH